MGAEVWGSDSLPALEEPASFTGSPRAALNIWSFGQKLLGCTADRLTWACGQAGRHQTADPKSVVQIFPTSQGAAAHPPPMTTKGMIETVFKLFFKISLAKPLSPPPTFPLAVPSVAAGWGHRPAPCWVTQSISITESTIEL